jgi:hypothetical protein
MDRQISAIVRAANFNLYRLGKVRGHLTTETTKILVHSLVITHLDYANSLLAKPRPWSFQYSHRGQKPWSYVFNHEKKEEEEHHTEAGLPEEVFHDIRPAPLEQTATGNPFHKHQTRFQETTQDTPFYFVISCFNCTSLSHSSSCLTVI